MSRYYGIIYSDSLSHHGILGQKWGVRRYQNKDGTLTPEGQKRYSDGSNKSSKIKTALKIGAAVVVTGLAAYGAYKYGPELVKNAKYAKALAMKKEIQNQAIINRRNAVHKDLEMKAAARNYIVKAIQNKKKHSYIPKPKDPFNIEPEFAKRNEQYAREKQAQSKYIRKVLTNAGYDKKVVDNVIFDYQHNIQIPGFEERTVKNIDYYLRKNAMPKKRGK